MAHSKKSQKKKKKDSSEADRSRLVIFFFLSQKEKRENRAVHLFQPLPPSSCSLMTFPNPSSAHGRLCFTPFRELSWSRRGVRRAPGRRSSGGRRSFSRNAAPGTVCSWTGCAISCLFASFTPVAPSALLCLPRPCCCSRLVPGLTLLLNWSLGETPLPEQGWSCSGLDPEAPCARIGPEPMVHPCFSE